MFVLRDGRYVPFEVKITATPMRIGEGRFLMVFMDDISSRKKREQLERTFFHDVMNTAGGVRNLALCLTGNKSGSDEQLARMIQEQSDLLIDEIRSQHLLMEAESDSLAVTPVDTSALVLFTEARTAAEVLKEAEGRGIRADLPDGDMALWTDTVLIRRALLNILKNALEATDPGGRVGFSMEYLPHSLVFLVHNDAVMKDEVRSQVFQRSFSTKGRGRGLGTYSMRLIVEHYLGGMVSFESAAGAGTEFRVELPLICPEGRD